MHLMRYDNVLLTVSNAIMNAHDGHIWVQSSGVQGEGCVFGMTLAISDIAPTSDLLTIADHSGTFEANTILIDVPQLTQNQYDLVHALVVDDSLLNRKMLGKHLNDFGIQNIVFAENGLEAVQAVEARMNPESEHRLFDVIFMDAVMPVMGGIEAIKRLRELCFLGAIVAVTGNGLPEDKLAMKAVGADEVLVKPINAVTVERTLKGNIHFYTKT